MNSGKGSSRISPISKKSPMTPFKSHVRTDAFGQVILKGNKSHRVTFNQKIQTIHVVENWKLYNIDKDEEDACSCLCKIM